MRTYLYCYGSSVKKMNVSLVSFFGKLYLLYMVIEQPNAVWRRRRFCWESTNIFFMINRNWNILFELKFYLDCMTSTLVSRMNMC